MKRWIEILYLYVSFCISPFPWHYLEFAFKTMWTNCLKSSTDLVLFDSNILIQQQLVMLQRYVPSWCFFFLNCNVHLHTETQKDPGTPAPPTLKYCCSADWQSLKQVPQNWGPLASGDITSWRNCASGHHVTHHSTSCEARQPLLNCLFWLTWRVMKPMESLSFVILPISFSNTQSSYNNLILNVNKLWIWLCFYYGGIWY